MERQRGTSSADCVVVRFALATAEAVENGDLALCQGWRQHILDVECIDNWMDDTTTPRIPARRGRILYQSSVPSLSGSTPFEAGNIRMQSYLIDEDVTGLRTN
ncbi:hypothetical protein [Bradyrhizobium genosp. P]|uniref:hypothetical protein n=1 Tax=Bradyrhizobium genosp. P TaxID=83641 RepID=UPI003CED389E